MGATYTRQSSTEIVDGEVINAADFNNEFAQLDIRTMAQRQKVALSLSFWVLLLQLAMVRREQTLQ